MWERVFRYDCIRKYIGRVGKYCFKGDTRYQYSVTYKLYIYIYIYRRGAYDKFTHFFRMGI